MANSPRGKILSQEELELVDALTQKITRLRRLLSIYQPNSNWSTIQLMILDARQHLNNLWGNRDT